MRAGTDNPHPSLNPSPPPFLLHSEWRAREHSRPTALLDAVPIDGLCRGADALVQSLPIVLNLARRRRYRLRTVNQLRSVACENLARWP